MSLEAWGDCDIDSDYDEDPNYCGYCGEPIPPGVDSFDCCGRLKCFELMILAEVERGRTYGIVVQDDNGNPIEIRVSGVRGEITQEQVAAFTELAKAALLHFGKDQEVPS